MGPDRAALKKSTENAAARLLRGRFTGLTITLLLLAVLAAIFDEHPGHTAVVSIAFALFVLFAALHVGPRMRAGLAIAGTITVLGQWTLRLPAPPFPPLAVFACTTAFLALLTAVILVGLFQYETVTADTIVGAICAYLLLGVTWASAYSMVVLLSPDAFSVSTALAANARWGQTTAPMMPLLQYYSFVTLSTMGFGDITPVTPVARLVSVLEGLTGQMYLAVVIARMVGMRMRRPRGA